MTRLGRMELIGTHVSPLVEKIRAETIARREQIIMDLNTTQTELAERIDFFLRHSPGHIMLDATRQRLADVRNEIAIHQKALEELKQIGVK